MKRTICHNQDEVKIKRKKSRKCCVKNCKTDSSNPDDGDIGFFHFPSVWKMVNGSIVIDDNTVKRCKKWVQNCGNEKVLGCNIENLCNSSWLVCSKHFEAKFFLNSRRLTNTAVPRLVECSPLIVDVSEDNLLDTKEQKDLQEEKAYMRNDLDTIFGREFDRKMENLDWYICENCKEKYLAFDQEKASCRHGILCDDYSDKNNMDPGTVPKVLQNLTFIEELLIARIHPLVSVFKLKGAQNKYSGNVVHFSQTVDELTAILPRKISDMRAVTTVRYTNIQEEYSDFQVRQLCVLEALTWLKCHNEFYKDVEINYANVYALPLNGNVYADLDCVFAIVEGVNDAVSSEHEERNDDEEEVRDDDFENISETCVPEMSIIHVQDQIRAKIYDSPTIEAEPINEFQTNGYITCCFPTLFPYGKADLSSYRRKTIKASDYFKHLICFEDDRFARHRTFRFFAFNSWVRWTALTTGNFYATQNSEFNNMSIGKLKSLIEEKPHIITNIKFHASYLRGTKSFWSAKSNELRDMIEQLGMPTILLTLSSADLHFPDLYRLLSHGEDVDNLTENDRRNLLRENPFLVGMFFEKRIECFIDEVLTEKYKIRDYWYRVEFQQSDSPSLHGFFWIEDAPVIEDDFISLNENDKLNVINYFKTMIHVVDPDPECEEPNTHPCRVKFDSVANREKDLAQLVRKVQHHTKCSSGNCLSYDEETHKMQCKFDSIFQMSVTRDIARSDAAANMEFLLARNDPSLIYYNSYILQVYRSNMSISPVLSKNSLLKYLKKYFSKTEPKSEFLREIKNVVLSKTNHDEEGPLQRIFNRSCIERDYSAQEVCHNLAGYKLSSAGKRNFVLIDLQQKDKIWIQVQESNSEEECNRDLTREKRSAVENYMKRPDHLKHTTLWCAAKTYDMSSWTKIMQRNVVRVFPTVTLNSRQRNNEEYYRQKVLLHVPWREESEFLVGGFGSWEMVFQKNKLWKTQENKVAKFKFVRQEIKRDFSRPGNK